ncbi:hypothetical protein [Thermanaeromonas toyohensis]|uniref:hypothetical protein n=1 Tax=Thermanaeromonas toyohensis TaxID=161154 RepID=UPI0012F5115F|nr:hypothetical protein [Thermanaeromonas toyohensis]
MAVLLFCALALPAVAVEAPAGSSTAVTDPGGIKPVSPGEFVAKVNTFIADLNTAVSGLVLPLATFAMLVSIAVITVGFLVGHSNLKRYGWGGLFLACVGVFLYYGVPLIIGLVRALAYRLAG